MIRALLERHNLFSPSGCYPLLSSTVCITQICDVSLDTMTVEMQGKAPKMAAFQASLHVLF